MAKVIINFIDEEIGDELVEIIYDETKCNFDENLKLALDVLYYDYYREYKDLKEDYPNLTKEIYDICSDILEGGCYGVTAERFCDFLHAAFGWECNTLNADINIDVDYGKFIYD